MCHGHVDLRTIEREVQDRLRAAKPTMPMSQDDDVTVPPGLIGGFPGLLARLRALLPRRRSAA
jgi:hypothetical protein